MHFSLQVILKLRKSLRGHFQEGLEAAKKKLVTKGKILTMWTFW